jgi:hypothetical protein
MNADASLVQHIGMHMPCSRMMHDAAAAAAPQFPVQNELHVLLPLWRNAFKRKVSRAASSGTSPARCAKARPRIQKNCSKNDKQRQINRLNRSSTHCGSTAAGEKATASTAVIEPGWKVA